MAFVAGFAYDRHAMMRLILTSVRRLHPRRVRWGWLLFVACIGALGYSLHGLLPHVPRWQIADHCTVVGFTRENIVVTGTRGSYSDKEESKSLTVSWWDLDSGRKLKSVDTFCSYYSLSPDCRILTAGAGGDFWIIDTNSGRRISVPGKW